jgi:L-threonylcarbamoyladenylate synthase
MNELNDDIENCIEVLKNGGVILYPTDTIWGIGCDATNEKAVAKIFSIKQREESKSLIILLDNVDAIKDYAEAPSNEIKALISKTKRPLTIIYNHAKNIAKNCINDDGTIAIRIPNHIFCTRLIKQFGKPIVSTSANISGESTAKAFKDISSEIKNKVDYTAQQGRNETCEKSSRIIKINDGQIIVIRD